MQRSRLRNLEEWLNSSDRNPMVIRGARQVGKTWLTRQLATTVKKQLFELNFEKRPEWIKLFDSNDPIHIINNLEAAFGVRIHPDNAILFLDEIQVFPELLAKLRWFAEEMPELPVIAAGSLLDFVLEEHNFSMPVGRINYFHLEPMSFEEFLHARGKPVLVERIEQVSWDRPIPSVIHDDLMKFFREYIIVGGMPAAVKSWTSDQSLANVNRIHHNLLGTYRDDFAKYRKKLDPMRLEETMMSIPRMIGSKFVYQAVNPDVLTRDIKQALDQLSKARIASIAYSSAGNGVPIGSEIRQKFFKVFFVDIGLCNAALGFNLKHIIETSDLIRVHEGGIAEQVIGQILRTTLPPYIEPHLYYWQRSDPKSNAEIDYLIQHANAVIPIEIKAGATGSLKSLHQFMQRKGLDFAIRFNSQESSITPVMVKDHTGTSIEYTLLSLPLYLAGQIHRLIDDYL
jgi:predicted AAA+ superfamily ATPase